MRICCTLSSTPDAIRARLLHLTAWRCATVTQDSRPLFRSILTGHAGMRTPVHLLLYSRAGRHSTKTLRRQLPRMRHKFIVGAVGGLQ